MTIADQCVFWNDLMPEFVEDTTDDDDDENARIDVQACGF